MNRNSSPRKICDIDSEKRIAKLSADATVQCSKCGSRSHDPASLCSPVRIHKSG